MTENTTEIERIEASELFAPASELPETNYRARTIAQICETNDGEITHPVECENCGRDTYAFERFCHRCGADRWDR